MDFYFRRSSLICNRLTFVLESSPLTKGESYDKSRTRCAKCRTESWRRIMTPEDKMVVIGEPVSKSRK